MIPLTRAIPDHITGGYYDAVLFSERHSGKSIWRLCKVNADTRDRWRSQRLLAVNRVSLLFSCVRCKKSIVCAAVLVSISSCMKFKPCTDSGAWFICWFQWYMNYLFAYLTYFISLFLPYLPFSHLLPYLSTSSRINPFRFQAMFMFILCCCTFCYGCMFAWPAHVAQWSKHSGTMCSRAWRFPYHSPDASANQIIISNISN